MISCFLQLHSFLMLLRQLDALSIHFFGTIFCLRFRCFETQSAMCQKTGIQQNSSHNPKQNMSHPCQKKKPSLFPKVAKTCLGRSEIQFKSFADYHTHPILRALIDTSRMSTISAFSAKTKTLLPEDAARVLATVDLHRPQ